MEMKLTSSDFCFPCTKCGCKFDSLRLVRKHNCETEEINISTKNTCDDRNILHKNQLKTIKDKPDQEKEKNILEEKRYVVSENDEKEDVRNIFKCELCYHTFINKKIKDLSDPQIHLFHDFRCFELSNVSWISWIS